jgi:glucuronokinase
VGDFDELGKTMNANFDLRRRLYGDGVIGEDMLRMKAVADAHGAPAKFPGSGGAMVGMCQDKAQLRTLKTAMEQAGFIFTELRPNKV